MDRPRRAEPAVKGSHPAIGSRGGDPSEAQELEWVRAIQRGDSAGLAPLLSRYQDRLFGVCMRMVNDRDLAADLTQDAMIKVIEGLGSFDARAKLSTWMIRVTMNVCLSRLRAERVRRHASLDAPTERGPTGSGLGGRVDAWIGQGGEPAPSEGVELDEVRRQVSAALLRVAPEQRAILVLRDCRALDYEQIAEVLAVPVGTVKSRLFRARAALREALEQDGRKDRPAARRAPDSAV